ncbi:hypothetical protein Tco_0596168 [Tanacetum coccineum]
MYIGRRSGRLSNRKSGSQGNDQDEVIDLTSPECDEAEKSEQRICSSKQYGVFCKINTASELQQNHTAYSN